MAIACATAIFYFTLKPGGNPPDSAENFSPS